MTQAKGYREMPLEGDGRHCNGRLVRYYANHQVYQCTECGWMGFPRMDIDKITGRILLRYPHPRRAMR